MNIKEKISISIIIVIVGIFAVVFGMKKVSYYSDEVWTYGLANNLNGINPSVEIGVKYSGYGPLDSFVKVKDGAGFNFANVIKNQTDDVHPPFYYFLVNSVCSIFADRFSKWYGISINLFWMVFIVIFLYKFARTLIANIFASIGITAFYGLSVMFLDSLIFIRMYTQLTFFFIALSYLIKKYWDRQLDKFFSVCLSLVLLAGMLTHYYFLIFIFAICGSFLIKLRKDRRDEEFRKLAHTILTAAIIYSAVWHQFFIHLFLGQRGQQAIYHAIVPKNIIKGPLYMIELINSQLLIGMLVIFLLLGMILLTLKIKHHEKIVSYNLVLLMVSIFYVFVVGTIAPFMDSRYIMPVGWVFAMEAYLITRSFFRHLNEKIIVEYALLIVFLILDLVNLNKFGWRLPKDYYYQGLIDIMALIEDYDAVVYLDEEWKPIIFFEELQHAKSYTYINEENAHDVFDSMDNDFFVLTCVEPEDEEKLVENLDAELVYRYSGRSYYHVTKTQQTP